MRATVVKNGTQIIYPIYNLQDHYYEYLHVHTLILTYLLIVICDNTLIAILDYISESKTQLKF